MPERVRIADVAPRDGLQNEPGVVHTESKAELVRRLARAGLDEIELTSFVDPARVPQLADAEALCEALMASPTNKTPVLSALVPNERGLDRLLSLPHHGRITKVAVFTAASETFCQRNINATIAESLDRFAPVLRRARDERLQTRAYVSCAVACPFEGPIEPHAARDLAARLLDLGVDEIDLADTIGAATTDAIAPLLHAVEPLMHDRLLTLHLHDTQGRAVDVARRALSLGVRSFDGSVAGIGGCPFASTPASRAPGNIATDALVRAVEHDGFETAVDHDALADASGYAATLVAQTRKPTQ